MMPASRILADAETRLDLKQRFRIARARSLRLLDNKFFDESQHPRDEHGRWADSGAVAFVSPNVADLQIDGAIAELHSARQEALRRASTEVDMLLGKNPVEPKSVVGAWSDGAENSLQLTMPKDWSFEQAKVAMAMKGWLGDQKSALVFKPHPDGDAYLASFPMTGKMDQIHQQLLDDGLAFHTLEPISGGTLVHVYGDDQATMDAVDKSAGKHGTKAEFTYGNGSFIGADTKGTDREQRDAARSAYEAIITAPEAGAEFSGRDVAKIWADLRDRWGRELATQTVAPKSLREHWQTARAEAQRLLTRGSAHTDWMNECVPQLMGYGKDQEVAIAACLNMWRDAWEEAHPDGADDPGPSPPEAKQLQIARERLRAFDESQHPRDEGGKFTDSGGGDGGGDKLGPGYSEHAKLKDGVIHTSNVYDAVLALHQDRKVELKQPKQLSTLIRKLGEVAKEMEAKGEKAPNFDLCNVTVKGTNLFCADTKGIPRIKMPQMDEDQTKAFLKHLQDQGYKVEKDKEKSANLRATQNQLVGTKVAKNAKKITKDPEANKRRIVVSRDDYILDGHHHWAGQIAVDAKDNKLGNHNTRISRVDIGIIKLLEEANNFTGGKGAKGTDEKRAQWRKAKMQALRLLKGFDPSQPRDEDGKWTGGGGSGGGSTVTAPAPKPTSTPVPPAPAPASQSVAQQAGKKGKATKADFDKAKIKIPAQQEIAFLDLWNDKIGEDPQTFKTEFMGGLNGDMTISLPSGSSAIKISGKITDASNYEVGTFDRNIDLGKKTAKSAYFSLNSRSRGNDIGKKLLAGNIETYQRLGIEKVGVFANIDVGGYAWAKYGYVPERSAWNSLRKDLERKLGGSSGGRQGGSAEYWTPESWDQMTSDNQDSVRENWMRDTRDDYVESERQNYWDNGQALDDTKRAMASDFDGTQDWATEALEKFRKPDDGIPYTNEQILAALSIDDYESRNGDGRSDPEFTFDDSKLREPNNALSPDQMLLPGFKPVDPSSHLTDDMRNQITDVLTKAFNDKADSDYSDHDVPDYIFDNVEDYQSESWEQMDDSDRYDYAVRSRLIEDTLIESDEADSEPVDVPEPEKNPLLDALHDPDPKAIWRVSDLPQGKKLLLGTSWDGALDLKDPETMARFNSYVGKASHA